ncbi:MAG: SDR family oxidoreductase [Truepera sp.]|nr:SDR family oxidoreductase [Truepera sp.]
MTTVNATYDFTNRAIVITGGAGDIGKAVAHRFAASCANVVLTDIDEAKLAAVVADLRAYRTGIEAYTCDVTDSSQVEAMVAAAIARFGRIDYLFNNAGYQGLFVKTPDYPEDDFRKVIDINVVGVFNVLKAVSRHMREAGGGVIVNTASYAGIIGPANMLAYGASKFAVIGITKTAAKDLAPYHIRVNAISPSLIGPGFMWTRQTELQAAADSQYFDRDPKVVEKHMIASVPLRRLGSLEEVANGVAFLLSDEASYITGMNLEITGGQ